MKKSLLLLLVFLVGCTHDYHGRQPDFHKEGAEAKQEYEKFKLHSLHQMRSTLGEEDGIRTSSLTPLIKDVSPKAHRMYRKMEIQRTIHSGLTAATWILIGVWALAGPDFPSGYFWGALGAQLGYSIYMDGNYQDVRYQYNRDLKHRLDHQKVAPHLGYSWKF
jgi:hypothetical protein